MKGTWCSVMILQIYITLVFPSNQCQCIWFDVWIFLNYLILLILSSQFYFGLEQEDLKLELLRINTMDQIGFKFRLINRFWEIEIHPRQQSNLSRIFHPNTNKSTTMYISQRKLHPPVFVVLLWQGRNSRSDVFIIFLSMLSFRIFNVVRAKGGARPKCRND